MSKAKNKKPGKPARLDSRNHDLSQLRKPVKISVSSLKGAAKLLETGTPEIKGLLTYEVDILYECRNCRSIFRSLLNLISHKRVFCTEKYNGSSGNRSRDSTNSVTTKDLQSLELDQITLDNLVNPSKNDRILRSQAPSVKTNKKDLTSVVDMLQKKQGDTSSQPENHAEASCHQVVLQVLNSKQAAYQTLVEPNLSQDDLMENQVIELDNILSQDSVVLGADGQIEKSDSPVHFYGNEESSKLVCDICSSTFMTQKTLDSHFRIKHAAVRDCYFCPCNPCSYSFSSYKNVKRHLTNAHRKIGQELEALSQQIEKRTVRSKPLPVLENKKSKKPGKFDNFVDNALETQEWIESLDSEELRECISCGEKFEEKSELLTHLKTCLGPDDERVNDIYDDEPELEDNVVNNSLPEIREINVQNTSNKVHQKSLTEVTSNIPLGKEGSNGLSIRVQGVSSLSEEEWRKIPGRSSENEEIVTETLSELDNSRRLIFCPKKSNGPSISGETILKSSNFVVMSMDQSRKRKSSFSEIRSTAIGEKFKKIPCQGYETDKIGSKRSSSQLFSDTIASISDHTKLECIACRRNFSNITSLNRHMENHIKINRYRCNKCDFRSTNRSDCVGHCNKIHNAMNNRQVLNEMISEIPQDQLTLSQEMVSVEPSNLNPYEVRRSNPNFQFGNINPITNIFKNRNAVINWQESNAPRLHSDVVNRSDTDTEPEDREAIYRRIDSVPNLQEMIREVVVGSNLNVASGASTSKMNGVGQTRVENNNVERCRKERLSGYSPALCDDADFISDYAEEENEISREFYPRNRKRPSSRASNTSESRMELRSSSRLSKKLCSDDEDEITRELYSGDERKSKSGKRSYSRSSKRSNSRMENRSNSRMENRSNSRTENRSNSRMENRSELRMVTRSQSRLGNRISYNEENDDDDYFPDQSSEHGSENSKPRRPKSRAKKENKETKRQSASRQGVKNSKQRRSAPGKISDTNSETGIQRRESFSSENSQIQRPIRSRVKHIDKDFVYDLEDPFEKSTPISPGGNSRRKSSGVCQFGQIENGSSKRLFENDSNNDLAFIRNFSNADSSSELDNAEFYFKGFPRQPEILNIE